MVSFVAPIKDPQAVLDYRMDWSPWLQPDELVTAFSATAQGVAISSVTHANGTVTFWLAEGEPTTSGVVTVEITTSVGRTDQRSITVHIEDR